MNSLPSAGKDWAPDVTEVADALRTRGEFVIAVSPRSHQQIVDLHWTAHRAARLLGIKVRVLVEGPHRGTVDPTVQVTVTPRASGRRHGRASGPRGRSAG